MRIAILSDVHGNPIALQAVLDEIDSLGGADEYWILGDLVALGHDPLGVLELLETLPLARYIRGNTDHYLVTGEDPIPSPEEIRADFSQFPHAMRLARSFAWTAGALTSGGWLPWLAALPLEMRVSLPDGTRVLAVHAAPGTDDGDGINIKTSDQEVQALVSGVEADLVLVGHTHTPFDRHAAGVRVVNPGSVSNPNPPDLRAAYALLTCKTDGYQLELRRAEYDRQAVIEAIQAIRHPSADYVIASMRGERKQD
jgi:predicted phosphodiesterase